jgi:hypothetical protein
MKSKVKYAALFAVGVIAVLVVYKKFAPASLQAKLAI